MKTCTMMTQGMELNKNIGNKSSTTSFRRCSCDPSASHKATGPDDVLSELSNTVKARKLAYCGHTMRIQENCLEKEIIQGTVPGTQRRERPRTVWIDNSKTWIGLPVKESVGMTEDRDKWRKYDHDVASSWIEDG